MDCVVHGVSKSRTQLSDFHFQMTLVVKNLPANAGDIRDVGLISGLGRSCGGGNGTHSGVLPGKLHGQRSLVGCSLRSCKRVRHD